MSPGMDWGLNEPSVTFWGARCPQLWGFGVAGLWAGEREGEPGAGLERETRELARSFPANYTWHFQTLINSSLGTGLGRLPPPCSASWTAAAEGVGVTPNPSLSPQPCPQPDRPRWQPSRCPSSQRSRLTGASQEQL